MDDLMRRIAADQLAAAGQFVRAQERRVAGEVKDLLAADLTGSPEAALRSNSAAGLRVALGLEDPDGAVAGVVDAVVDAVRVEVAVTSEEAALTVRAYRERFIDALTAATAAYPNAGRAGGEIEWLAWLLFGTGDGGYGHLAASFGGRGAALLTRPQKPFRGSRTGPGIMVPLGGKVRRPFDLPSPWVGSAEDNWLTRSAGRVGPEVTALLGRVANEFGGG